MIDKKLDSLRRVQRDILRVFIETCEREKLSYFAMFGTMIGAVRHGGFIPWDDDIDVAMPREDYDKLCGIAGSFRHPYFLQTPETDPSACVRLARLMNLNTTYLPYWYPDAMVRGGRLGCCIDILPLDEVPDAAAAEELADEAAANKEQRRFAAALEEMPLNDMPEWKRELCCAVKEGSYAELTLGYHEICTRYKGRGAEFYTVAAAMGNHRALLMPKRCFDNYTVMSFDNLRIRVPEGYAELSDTIYENGAELPGEDEREPKHKGFYDTENPYTKYTARYENVFDGLSGKKLLLFGAGNMLEIFMARYGTNYPPVCTFDNDPKKWGKTFFGVKVKNPCEIPDMMGADTRLVIINMYHREISEQLEEMGINDFFVFMDGWKYDTKAPGKARVYPIIGDMTKAEQLFRPAR